jgi:Asp-tRNA(Asn)/Glu-tRNA(Gln) amidotransferase A subunit family amidase
MQSSTTTQLKDMLRWRSASELAAQIAAGELSSETVVRACLENIALIDPQLHAFITVAGEHAIHQACAADREVKANKPLGLLHGVPVALKDEIWTRNIRSTGGSLIYKDFLPGRDAAVVERLDRAGAIIIGKTQMPEFAMWPRSLNRICEEALNPHDPRRISGASSGGSAVSVAAGMTPLAIGSDGGGSTRIPASICGLFGFHPTPGIVPDAGTFSYSPHASLGPMSRNVRDAALLLQVMVDPKQTFIDYLANLEMGVAGLRIAWVGDYGWIDTDPRVLASARAGALMLAKAGAIVEEPSVFFDDIWPAFGVYTRGYALYEPGVAMPYVQSKEHLTRCMQHPELLMPGVAELLSAPAPSQDEYKQAKAIIKKVLKQWQDVFARYDLLCSPTMPNIAPCIIDGNGTPYADDRMGTNYTSIVNITHGTAASFPCGEVDNLPVGLQVMATAGQESLVLRACRSLEKCLRDF